MKTDVYERVLDFDKKGLKEHFEIYRTRIFEIDSGEIFNRIHKRIIEINEDRFRKGKKEVNRISMSPTLYTYLKLVLEKEPNSIMDNVVNINENSKLLFGLEIIIRDDFDINEIDIYRDVSGDW